MSNSLARTQTWDQHYFNVLRIQFGKGGNATAFQLQGWSDPEPGYTFSIGPRSTLNLRPANILCDKCCMLEILAKPFTNQSSLPCQTLSVRVNGVSVGHSVVTGRSRMGFLLPRQMCSNGLWNIVFEHASAKSPSTLLHSNDTRILGFAFFEINVFCASEDFGGGRLRSPQHVRVEADDSPESLTMFARDRYGIDIQKMLLRFESLGDNCEFGLFQRRFGVEPLSLFRFSAVYLDPLVEGLESGFEGLGQLENLQPKPEDMEWMIYENKFKLRYHTFVRSTDMSEDEIKAREHKKLDFLRRKFLEDVDDGEKIFVYKRATSPLSMEEILPLFRALSPKKANKLLWVVPATDGYPAGTVEEILPGLLRGHIDRLAHLGTPIHHSTNGWVEISLAAWNLVNKDVQITQ